MLDRDRRPTAGTPAACRRLTQQFGNVGARASKSVDIVACLRGAAAPRSTALSDVERLGRYSRRRPDTPPLRRPGPSAPSYDHRQAGARCLDFLQRSRPLRPGIRISVMSTSGASLRRALNALSAPSKHSRTCSALQGLLQHPADGRNRRRPTNTQRLCIHTVSIGEKYEDGPARDTVELDETAWRLTKSWRCPAPGRCLRTGRRPRGRKSCREFPRARRALVFD